MKRRDAITDPDEGQIAQDAREWARRLYGDYPAVRAVVVEAAYNVPALRRRTKQHEKAAHERQAHERREALRFLRKPALLALLRTGDLEAARASVREWASEEANPLFFWCESMSEAASALENCLRHAEICYEENPVGSVLWLSTWHDPSHPY